MLYSTFFQRAYDQVVHDVLLQNLPVIFCLDRSGLVGPDGPTHHGVFDISMLINLPNIVIAAPRNGNELDNLLITALNNNIPFCIRYPKASSIQYDESIDGEVLDIGVWEKLHKGSKVAILATGSTVEIASNSLEEINQKFGFYPSLINCRFIKPLDYSCLDELVKTHDYIITMEEGAIKGGFGNSILNYYKHADSLKVDMLGIPDSFIEHGTRQELLDLVGLNTNSLINLITDYISDEKLKG